MRYLGQAAFFLTFLAAGLAFVLNVRGGAGGPAGSWARAGP